jgi:hypothetical protein
MDSNKKKISLLNIKKNEKIAFIELGCNCNLSLLILHIFKLRIYSSPFKWCLVHDLKNTVVESIKNNFKDFLNIESIPDTVFSSAGDVKYINKYKQVFPHEKVKKIDEKKFILDKEYMIERYKKRIERFYNIFKDADYVFLLRSTQDFYDYNLRKFNNKTKNLEHLDEIKELKYLCNFLEKETFNKNINYLYFNNEDDYNFLESFTKYKENIIYGNFI